MSINPNVKNNESGRANSIIARKIGTSTTVVSRIKKILGNPEVTEQVKAGKIKSINAAYNKVKNTGDENSSPVKTNRKLILSDNDLEQLRRIFEWLAGKLTEEDSRRLNELLVGMTEKVRAFIDNNNIKARRAK